MCIYIYIYVYICTRPARDGLVTAIISIPTHPPTCCGPGNDIFSGEGTEKSALRNPQNISYGWLCSVGCRRPASPAGIP